MSLSRELILEYFDRTGVAERLGTSRPCSEVKAKVYEIIQAYNIGLPEDTVTTYVEAGLIIATTAYRHVTDVDVQVAISIYTFCMCVADDDNIDLDILRSFVPRFYTRRPQLHPLFDLFLDVITVTMRKHYSTFSANSIISGSMDWYNAEMFLRGGNASGEGSYVTCKDSGYFVDFIRWKTGDGESYAAQIWPRYLCPDTKAYIQAIP